MRTIVHYLHHGQTACAKPGPPKLWKAGHKWSGDWDDVDCPRCLSTNSLALRDFKKAKAKAKAKRRVPKQAKRDKPVTLEDVVRVAHALGAEVNVKLVPNPVRPKLALPFKDWPGDVCTRATMAAMDYTERDVAKVFKTNPTALWVVTPFEIIERTEFFKPKPVAPTPSVKPEPTPNPS